MDWESFTRSGALKREAGDAGSVQEALLKRAWSDIVDSRTALAVHDHRRIHACLEGALSKAAEAFAGSHGYARGPEWTREAARELAVRAFGGLAVRAFEQHKQFGGMIRDEGPDSSSVDEQAIRGVEAASAFVAYVESRLRS